MLSCARLQACSEKRIVARKDFAVTGCRELRRTKAGVESDKLKIAVAQTREGGSLN